MATLKHLDFHALSDIGFKRARNEDAHLIADLMPSVPGDGNRGHLFAVADGIGGNACGDLASRMSCSRLEASFNTLPAGPSPVQYKHKLVRVFRSIDKDIRRQSVENPTCTDMGTTLSALILFEHFSVVAHVGDSRIYRLQDARLTQLTTDHTFVQDMIAEGDLPPESAETHPLRHMLTRAVGTQEPLDEVQSLVLDVSAGDRYLLSTDGLHGPVANSQIASILEACPDPKRAAERLLSAALDNGGNDNVTIIVVYL